MAKKYPFTKANVQETQEAVYKYIVEYISANAYSPSIRDICVGVGLKSTSTVHNHLRRLSEEGLIQFHEGKRRTIRVPALDAVDSQEIPLVGTVTAGEARTCDGKHRMPAASPLKCLVVDGRVVCSAR